MVDFIYLFIYLTAFYSCIKSLICVWLAVVPRGAGRADPGADEERWELLQPVGPQTAGRLHGLSRIAGRSARLPAQ